MTAWYFAYVDRKQADIIKKKHTAKRKGFGSIRVVARVGGSTWKTSIFPDTHSGAYVLPLKKAIRRAEGIDAGDTINFSLEI